MSRLPLADLAASFQQVVVPMCWLHRSLRCCSEDSWPVQQLVMVGGVAANQAVA